MRTLLAAMLAFLPLVQPQDSLLLKSVEPRYDKYSADLATDFYAATASVTMTVTADGKPFTLDNSTVPLSMAVVMALKEYEFRPQGVVPHGQPVTEGDTYQVTLNVPIRQSKDSVRQSEELHAPQNPALDGQPAANRIQPTYRVPPSIAKAFIFNRVDPIYPGAARHARTQGRITLEAVITKQGDVESLKTSNGPFVLIEAAYEAVNQWQYRPYLIKGEAVEIQTEIDVVFNLNAASRPIQ